MKKLLLLLILLLLPATAFACGSDGECYEYYLQIDNKEQTYVMYHYKNTNYKIIVPKSRTIFIELENLYNSWRLAESHMYYNTVKINSLLVKLWLEPLYY